MQIEQIINQKLNKYPSIKKGIKRIYQRIMYFLSPKIKSEGNIIRVSPNDKENEYFLDIMINLHGMLQIDICFV